MLATQPAPKGRDTCSYWMKHPWSGRIVQGVKDVGWNDRSSADVERRTRLDRGPAGDQAGVRHRVAEHVAIKRQANFVITSLRRVRSSIFLEELARKTRSDRDACARDAIEEPSLAYMA